MSAENEDQRLSVKSEFDEAKQKQSKISYARDFLLSFGELEVCKRLPSGFNPSMLCGSLDASGSIFDMQKTTGGKEDIHSSGWNNRDCHSQGNWVSDNGSGHGGHSQYSKQNAVFVYNGFLGSGTSKVSHGTAGAMAPKVQANGNYQLSKSDNPYRPPHSSKVVPKAVRESDSYRERISSSAEYMNMERAEEEKAEGASFDLTRKKEQKAIQDKQKQLGHKHGMLLSQDSPNDVTLVNKSEECMISSYLDENSAKSSTPAQNSVSRPRLGNADFTSKNQGIKSLTHSCKFKPRKLCDVEADKTHRPIFHTKNFADWFVREGKKKVGGCSSLSTKGSSEDYGTSSRLVTEQNIATFSSYRNAQMCNLTKSTLPSAERGASESTESDEVLTCEELKQSTLSENNKDTASQHHFAPGLGAHDVEDQQLHSDNEDGSFLYFSSLSQKGVTSSKHKMSSLHENFLPVESDCSVASVLTKGNSKTRQKSQAFEPNFGIGFAKDFEYDEMPLSFLSGSLDGISGPVVSNPDGFPTSVADDNFLTSITDEYRSIGTNFEGSRAANLAEITELANTEVNQSTFDDDWAEILSMLIVEQESDLSAMYSGRCQMSDSTVQIQLAEEDSLIAIDDLLTPQQLLESTPETAPKLQREQESKLIPIAGCNESALEYYLPDEESLITFDDMIIPQQLVSMSAVRSRKYHMLPSNIAGYDSGKLPAQNVVEQNERSAEPGYCGAMNPGNSYRS